MSFVIPIPQPAREIIGTLTEHGFDAYIVGGCVRDSLLKKEPKDWDITTSAKPEQVKALFRRTVDTGLKHGTVTVMIGKEGYEVTTYRIDGEYKDHRRPEKVEFTTDLREDLRRRDFTINAMAYHPDKGVIDCFSGLADLEKGVIRCVGSPYERFEEDALRMLRAVRFAAQLNFTIEEQTKAAIKKKAETLKDISAERIQVELTKLITSSYPELLFTAYELGITKVVLPEFDTCMSCPQHNPHHCYNVGVHLVKSMQAIENTPVYRWTMLLHDIAKPLCLSTDEEGVDHFYTHCNKGEEMAVEILRRLKFDNDTIKRVSRLVKHHDYECPLTEKSIRKMAFKIGPDLFLDLLKVQEADTLAKAAWVIESALKEIEEKRRLFLEVEKKEQCLSLKELKMTGKDLIAMGIKPGKEMGVILNELLLEVLETPEKNNYEYLSSQVKRRTM